MKVFKAPDNTYSGDLSIFLAGSIEMGKAVDWQTEVTNALSDLNVQILNPRRDDWDSSWVQSKDNAKFREQVEWELNALHESDVIIMYFDPKTMSPISMLEFGLYANSEKLIVYCPEGFWRKGNIDVTSEWYGVKQVDTLAELIIETRLKLGELQ